MTKQAPVQSRDHWEAVRLSWQPKHTFVIEPATKDGHMNAPLEEDATT